jgi:hypothetical protein
MIERFVDRKGSRAYGVGRAVADQRETRRHRAILSGGRRSPPGYDCG